MVKFKNIEITREDVLKEIDKYDAEFSSSNEYKNWKDKGTYKYSLEFNGKSYPPKYLLSRLTGLDLTKFSGGDQTNKVFKTLNFKIKTRGLNKQYWKVAPGEKARFWDRCRDDSNIAVGWEKMKDLSTLIGDYDNFKKQYLEVFVDQAPQRKEISMNGLWNFINLKEGDVILANRGLKEVVGIGEITGHYKYNPDYSEYKHTIPVEWFDTTTRKIPHSALSISSNWFAHTIKELSEQEFQALIGEATIITAQENSVISLLKKKRQIILYGPPGTGKTFNTKDIAVKLMDHIYTSEGPLEIDEIKEDEIEGDELKIDNALFNDIKNSVLKLSGTTSRKQKSMVGYYSESTKSNKKLGLVWIGYPTHTGYFKVYLRKPLTQSYPETLINALSNYKSEGWGGYPEIKTNNEKDAATVIQLIKYAYDYL